MKKEQYCIEKLDRYAKRYDDTNVPYLPLKIQLAAFLEEYEEAGGGYNVSVPTFDAEHTPGTYVSTAKVWRNHQEAQLPAGIANFTARVKPDELDPASPEEQALDPFMKCQYRALSNVLRQIGFWVSQKLIDECAAETAAENTASEEEVKAIAPVAEAEEPKKKRGRGRPRKEAVVEEENESTSGEVSEEAIPAGPASKETVEETVEEKPETVEPAVEAPAVEEAKPVETPKPAVKVDANGMDYETAAATRITWREWNDYPLGELGVGEDKSADRLEIENKLLYWLATSDKASMKFTEEQLTAAKLVYNRRNGM